MKRADYKCTNCDNIEEITIRSGEFPKKIGCLECGCDALRTYSPLPAIIHLGKHGNASNGYTDTGGDIKKSKLNKE